MRAFRCRSRSRVWRRTHEFDKDDRCVFCDLTREKAVRHDKALADRLELDAQAAEGRRVLDGGYAKAYLPRNRPIVPAD